MKALVFHGESGLRLEQVAEPALADGEVRVHVGAAGVCGSDLGWFRGGMPSVSTPVVPGHEFGGMLDDGTSVVINPMVGCGTCLRCAAGNTHLCAQRRIIGIHRDGAYAERVSVPRHNVVAADVLDPVRAALVEPIANGVHGWDRAGRPTGAVAIIGAGAIGMCLLHVLRSKGLSNIMVVDPMSQRCEAARAAGATATSTRLTGQFDAVFDAAGTRATRADAIACTAAGGTTALLGLHDDVLSVSAAGVIVGDKTIAGCFGYSEPAFREAVALAASIDAPWVAPVPIDDARQVVEALVAGRGTPGAIKTMIRFTDVGAFGT